MKTDTLQLVR